MFSDTWPCLLPFLKLPHSSEVHYQLYIVCESLESTNQTRIVFNQIRWKFNAKLQFPKKKTKKQKQINCKFVNFIFGLGLLVNKRDFKWVLQMAAWIDINQALK